jgi:hypothetical protein
VRAFPEVIILAALASCDGAFQYRDVQRVEGSVPLAPAIRTVRLEAASGSFIVVPGPGDLRYEGGRRCAGNGSEVLDRLRAIPLLLEAAPDPGQSDVLRLREPAWPSDLDPGSVVVSYELRIFLPAELAIEIEVAGHGHLEAEGRRGPVRLSTRRGDLRLKLCEGPAVLYTGHGVTIVDRHRGDLTVEAGTGEMQVFVQEPGQRLTLATGLGNVMCYLPPDAGFRISARTLKGKVHNAFGLPPQRVQDWGGAITGVVGDGRTEIVLRTGAGMVGLNRKTYD